MISWIPDEWIASISSSTIVMVLGFFFGNYYKSKVEKSIQNNYDRKIETLRSAFRRDEEKFRADLQAKGRQIEALRTGVLAGLASRHAELDRRRLDAIENMWRTVVELEKYKNIHKIMQRIDVDAALKISEEDNDEARKIRSFAELMLGGVGVTGSESIGSNSLQVERLHVPPVLWALYKAYMSALIHPIAQLLVIKNGLGAKMLSDPADFVDLVRSIFPENSDIIDNLGEYSIYFLIEEMEVNLLSEMKSTLIKADSSDEALNQAAKIIKHSEDVLGGDKLNIVIPDSVVR
ncbi:hypothetical protein [Stappia sp. WLB 29]|uniref:hypothetical protein n=1 Tax=Stappia sp. WLB 29 TaxID=2925220 RepID=UPI0020BF3506|nr:hypothetical protein [Stappia sp. WLB 29]